LDYNKEVKLKILCTGNLGFVGSETTKLLEKEGHEIIGYDIMNGKDIRNYQKFYNICYNTRPDRILHLAAIARFAEADSNPIITHETNVLGTQNVVRVCKELQIPLVFASTGSAYMPIKEKPPITEKYPIMGNSVYGCSKALADKYVQQHNPHIILRYAHLYGKEKRYHGLIGGFLSRIEFGLEPVLYGGKQSNDFCYIKDVAQANMLALTASWDKWNQAYNIGSGEEITAEEAGKIVCDVVGYKGDIQIKPQRTVDPDRFFYDITKAKEMLGFNPKYTFKKGVKDMM
jgi:UDP-N-acetylglucosamine 4-epimerase